MLDINEDNYKEVIAKGEIELNRKFLQIDELYNAKGTEEEINSKIAELCKDPSLWAYGFLKDKQNERLRVYYFQDLILNDKHRFIHVTASNQIGKTWAVVIKALHHAIFVNNASITIVSRTEDQAKYILDEIKWMMRRSNINRQFNEIIDEVENRFEIHIKSPDGIGVSAIRVFPPTQKVLAFPATLIIGDEVAFWEEIDSISYYDQVLEPRTNTTRFWKHDFIAMGQIIFITNPNGQQGLAWRCYADDSRFNNYRVCWLGKPNNTMQEYNEARTRLPGNIFSSVYAAEYVSLTGAFITEEQIKRFESHNINLIIPPNSILYLGADFAGEDVKSRDSDFSVIYGVMQEENPNMPKMSYMRVVYRKVFRPKTKKTVIYEEIERLKHNLRSMNTTIAKFAYDKVGVGDSVRNDLVDRGLFLPYQIESLTYSLENKSEIYYNLKHLFEQGLLKGSVIPELRKQLLGLYVEQAKNSIHIKVHHKTSGVHDDECFTAGTLILTNKGNIPIEELKIGDLVMTRQGYKKITAAGNRIKKVIAKFGLTGTPDHPFITKQGIKKFINIEVSDILYIWNQKLFSIEEKNIIDFQNQEGDILGYITGVIQNGKNLLNHYTGKFMRIIMKRFQKDVLSIILMVIHLTILSEISNQFQEENIQKSIQTMKNSKRKQNIILKNMQDQKQDYGINQKREENGIKRKRLNKDLAKRRVYNIAVEDSHEYFANNILVHNCDALANACYMARKIDYVAPSLTIVIPDVYKKKITTQKDEDEFFMSESKKSWITCISCGNYFYYYFNDKKELEDLSNKYCEYCNGNS